MEIFFSQLMFISVTSPLVLCMYTFVLNLFHVLLLLYLFLARNGRGYFNKAYFCFLLVCTNGIITTAHLILTIMLSTFEAEILKIFKNT